MVHVVYFKKIIGRKDTEMFFISRLLEMGLLLCSFYYLEIKIFL